MSAWAGLNRNLVNQIVHRVATMALDPLKVWAFRRRQTFVELNEWLPKIIIGDWLFLSVAPTVGFPLHPPAIFKTVHHVGRVAHDDQSLHLGFGDRRIGLESFICGREFHALVCRFAFAA